MGLGKRLTPLTLEEKLDLEFERVEKSAVLPTRAHETDAGFDLYCQDDFVIAPGGFGRLGTGVKVKLFDDEWGLLVGRSSALAEHGLLVAPGVVDPSYKGELMLAVQNLLANKVFGFKGQRLAQFILMNNRNLPREPVWGSVGSGGSRGSEGFGSSGR